MGTPSNQQVECTARDVLRDILRGVDHSVKESDLRATGVDVDLLEAMYDENLRPYLDYLHGYKRLEELDPVSHRKTTYDVESDKFCENESWSDVLARHGMLGQYSQVLVVHSNQWYGFKRDNKFSETVEVRVYLTRKGTWLSWYAVVESLDRGEAKDESLSAHASLRDLWQGLHSLLPDEYSPSFSGYNKPEKLPLSIEYGLRRILRDTIAERQKRLDAMKSALDQAHGRMAIVRGIKFE